MTLLEKIAARRRSTDPHCWTCSTYPHCNLCQKRHSLRRIPKPKLTPEQKKACRKIIRHTTCSCIHITPAECRVKAETAEQLERAGILILRKKAEFPCKYTYLLNIDHPDIRRAYSKHLKRLAKLTRQNMEAK